jgi:hypothetical protein
MSEPPTNPAIPPLVDAMPGAPSADCDICGLDTYYRCAIGDGFAPICSEECRRAFPRVQVIRDRLALVAHREAELHYAIRRDANILDHKLTEEEAHTKALARVQRMHAEIDAQHALASRERHGGP